MTPGFLPSLALAHLPPLELAGVILLWLAAIAGAGYLLLRVVRLARALNAERVEVTVRRTGDSGVLLIRDDGRGFSPASVENAGGFGLRSMTERAARVGGALSVESAPGAGTRVRVEVPL